MKRREKKRKDQKKGIIEMDTLYSQITRRWNSPGGHGMHFDCKAVKNWKFFRGGTKVPVGQGTL